MATPARQGHSAQYQQPPQTPVVDADIILEHKENIKPLASGRRAAALADVFTPKSKEERSARLAANKKKHMRECDDALDNDDDPLAAFVRFVDWTVDNYPQGECVESGLLELLELATRTFADSPLYKNDMRYLKLWILYASIVDHPTKIYAYLNSNEIGTGYSLFYEEYCNTLERCGQRRETAEMYDIGIARRAHPLQRLQARRRDFNIRMMSSPAQAPDAPPPSRPALGNQSSGHLGLRESNFALPSMPGPGNNRGVFQIYTGEDETRASENSWPELESRDSHRKENHRSAIPAQGETLRQKVTTPSIPKLDVYVDEGAAVAPKTPGKTPSKELAAKSSSIEALKRDPLRNFQQQPLAPPPVPAAVNLATSVSSSSKLPSTFTSTKPFSSISSPTRNKDTSLPAVKANELLEIDLSLYTIVDGTEINPAEQRTMRLGLSNKAWPAPPVHLLLAAPTLSTSSNQDTSGNLSIGNMSGRTGRHREATTSVNFSGEPSSHTSNTRRSRVSVATNHDATVTINTKEGLKDVYGFFNSPTKSMKLEGIEESVRKPPKAAMKTVEFSENAGVPPTPTPGTFKMEDENAMSVKKGVFRPLNENETPAPKRTSDLTRTPGLAFQPPPSAGATKTPGTAKRALAPKHVTPAAGPAPAPVLEIQETDEEEYEGEDALPDPETPFARKKLAVGFVPLSDDVSAPAPKGLQIFEGTSSTPAPAPAPKALQIFEDVAEPEDEGPSHEEDLFAVQDSQSHHSAFKPFQDRESSNGEDDEDEDGHDLQQGEEGHPSETQEDPYSDEVATEGEEDEQQPAAGGRWAPALTPITERTYEPTSTFSNRWTTPLEQRDQSVADHGTFAFNSTEAARAAARLAEELRAEEEEETRDLQRMRFVEMYRRESIGLRQSLGGSGEEFTNWTEEVESGVGDYSVREDETPKSEEEAERESSRFEPPEVVDPYTTETLLGLLGQFEIPPTHRDMRPATANQLDKLQKAFKTRGRTSRNTSRGSQKKTSGLDEEFSLELDSDHYNISGKLGEGGFGAVFLATDVAAFERLEDEGEDAETLSKVAVKVVKPATVWESYALDLIHQNVDPFILPSIIKQHNLYIFGDESYLVLDYSHCGTLLEAVNRAGELGIGQGLGGVVTSIPGMDEMLAMFFTVELLRTVEGLHLAGFIHGDLKIDNCMVRLDPSPPGGLDPQYDPSGAGGWSTKGIRLIDFGRTIDTRLFPPGQQFTTDWKVDKRDCLEMRQKLPWTYETDYYGLAGIVYCLLYGKYMEMPVLKDVDGRFIQKLPATLKRHWKGDIWEPFFDMLLNPHQFGTELPIVDKLSSMRGRMEAWLVDNSAKNPRKSPLSKLLKRLAAAHI